MTARLQSEQVLNRRFRLERRLVTGTSSQLWRARDIQLESAVLLRVYLAPTLAGSGVLENIRRNARLYRRLHDAHVAVIHDVHDEQAADGYLVVSIEAHDGTLLEAGDDRTTPMPYRSALRAVRPIIEVLQKLHEGGGQHGRLDAEHILVQPDGAWILLPGDGTRSSRSDMQSLGTLLTGVLTGGEAPDPDRALNDFPDRLHRGRTVPALLDQLISDLRASDPVLQPASMHEVLSRLDQIEGLVGPPEEDAPAPGDADDAAPAPGAATPASSATPTTTPRAASRATDGRHASTAAASSGMPVRALAAWALVPVLLLAGAGVIWSVTPSTTTTDAPLVVEEPPDAAVPDEPEASRDEAAASAEEEAARAAALLAAQADADAALGRYLTVRGEADVIGVPAWGGEPFAAARAAADDADRAYVAKEFATAADRYSEAAEAFQALVDGKDAALSRLLETGRTALATSDSARAESSFRSALFIDPGNDEAELGLRRAGTLDELERLLASGQAHERSGDRSLAYVDYAAALQLDPASARAASALEAISNRMADDQFQAMMSAALEAFHLGDFDAADAGLEEAGQFRPGAPEVASAQSMVEEARVRRRITRLEEDARAHEGHEQWQAAWNTYREVLTIDPAIEFAQRGTARAETMIRLETHTRHYLANPDLLIARGSRDDAARLVTELADTPGKGPRLQRDADELARQVRLAATPRRVIVRSDERTEVDIYRVGRYGAFDALELELLPGIYTIVGHRAGYRDVRIELRLEPSRDTATVEVVCREAI